jgi:hypothetical protein
MQVEQAIFTSARSRRFQGYHLVAKSAGIGDRIARDLERWGPTEGALLDQDEEATCFSFFPVTDGWFVIGRTTYGIPEYSARGSLQVTTFYLAVRPEQFVAYESHALALAYTALTLGYLRLTDHTTDSLPSIDLPNFPFAAAQPLWSDALDVEMSPAELIQDRFAIVGAQDPEATAYHIISSVPRDQRSVLSFCTGLRPSSLRPFQMHIYRGDDTPLRRQLADLQIRPVNSQLFGQRTSDTAAV